MKAAFLRTSAEELAGFVRKEMSGGAQMRGYQWLHPRALKTMYVVSQGS